MTQMIRQSTGASSILPGITPAEEDRFARYLVEREGLAPGQVPDALVALGMWLCMCTLPHEESFVPSPGIDKLWHALILHTRLYAKVCQGLGKTIHHNPTLEDERDGGEGYRRTLAHMLREGMPFNPGYWPASAFFECREQKCSQGCTECGE